jgi:hypothetical protein
LLLSLHDKGSPSVAVQLAEEVRRQVDVTATPLTLAELIGVGVAMFSLVGVVKCVQVAKEEVELNKAFAALAMQRRSCDLPFLKVLGIGTYVIRGKILLLISGLWLDSIPDPSDSHAGVVSRFEVVFRRLEGLGAARDHLSQFRYAGLRAPTQSSSQSAKSICDPCLLQASVLSY